MLQTMVIDIETVRDDLINPQLLQSLLDGIEVKADGRIKDEEKIKADVELKTQLAIAEIKSKFALSPMTGKICCFGWKCDGEEIGSGTIVSANEAEIITKIGEVFSLTDQLTTFVTFNGKSFDMPFIRIRSALYGININFPRLDTKYNLDSHFDVRSALTNFDTYGKGTLTQWGMFFGVKLPELHTGQTIQMLYDEGKYSEIRSICMSDIETTHLIYNKIKEIYK